MPHTQLVGRFETVHVCRDKRRAPSPPVDPMHARGASMGPHARFSSAATTVLCSPHAHFSHSGRTTRMTCTIVYSRVPRLAALQTAAGYPDSHLPRHLCREFCHSSALILCCKICPQLANSLGLAALTLIRPATYSLCLRPTMQLSPNFPLQCARFWMTQRRLRDGTSFCSDTLSTGTCCPPPSPKMYRY